eukprot:2921199-Pyramimonas_sp.AAC.1
MNPLPILIIRPLDSLVNPPPDSPVVLLPCGILRLLGLQHGAGQAAGAPPLRGGGAHRRSAAPLEEGHRVHRARPRHLCGGAGGTHREPLRLNRR